MNSADVYLPRIRLGVYIGLTVVSGIYTICNWNKATSFTFFSEFNGINLIFVVWIILLLMPIVTKFEGFGLNFTSLFHDLVQKVQQTNDEYEAQIKTDEREKRAKAKYEATKKEKTRIILSSNEHGRESDV